MTAAEALRGGTARLAAAGIEGAARDARVLLAHAMGVGADRLTLHLGDGLSEAAVRAYEASLLGRACRQPVAQIIGQRLFWGRVFRVTRDVLDPRPETEILVAAALGEPFIRVLDLGTGSGAILLTLLAERTDAIGLGTDLSAAALDVARHNASVLGVGDRADFALSDWFDGVSGSFDLIVSNPPYIAAAEMASLAPEVRDWEPHLALSPGGDGLDAYRAITAGALAVLAPTGRLLMEIGPTQADAVAALCAAAGLGHVAFLPDLDGRDRVAVAQRT